MSSNTAVVVQKPGEAKAVEASIPKLRDDYILIKTKAVALNPTDWKHVEWLTSNGARVGCDYAGVVEEVGSAVTKDFKKGDRVCGFCHGGNEVNHDDGAFANIITAKGDNQIKIPDNLSFEEAATLGVGITTVGQGLYQSLQLPLPTSPASTKFPVLIYGGSTATGALAIQYAKLSGLTVVTTASPRNFAYLESLGADKVFDYNSPTCSQDIKDFTNDSIKHAFDCMSEGSSTQITVSAMSSSGGVYSTLLPVATEEVHKYNTKVENKSTLGYTCLGEKFTFGATEIPAKPEDFEFAKTFWEMSRGLLADGKIKVHKVTLNKFGEGFEGILNGMQAMKEGKVSGEKLVYTL
ncbi:putative zinc-binding oxidoreductase protein [Botrytis fragariae]|uniref:Putative zinc-binding oxidoreductase protein n=1 Tax=Botrytis fragariae TaxID=1964551 RepID=A0A8H6B2R7_9HELO|nr:putative zinc-binding oxidoreductase protein [Botrytis fragariae]KAF5878304.1 putative zinc-binding oxidoreductase protein [Botrytis fragariae]